MSEKEPNIEEDVLEAIMKAWSKHPQLRLGQLIYNAVSPAEACPEISGVEDSKLIKLLNRLAEK